jgi:RES domain-containing protein
LTRVYRLLRKRFAKSPLSGEGAYLFGGRWSSPGTRIAYTSEHLSLAMIEYFVHVDPDDAPRDLMLVTADVPDSVSRVSLSMKLLPPRWRGAPAPLELAAHGDQFVRARRAAILVVPSALAPSEANWLINPAHPDAARIRVNPAEPFEYDRRFFE